MYNCIPLPVYSCQDGIHGGNSERWRRWLFHDQYIHLGLFQRALQTLLGIMDEDQTAEIWRRENQNGKSNGRRMEARIRKK